MAKLPVDFPIGNRDNIDVEKLLELLEKMYRDLAQEINRKPDVYERDTDGLTTDTNLSNGSITINKTTRKIEMLSEHSTGSTVVWTTIS